jgi:hypothetical protein
MSVGQAYLLIMGVLVLFALLGGLYIMWTARERQKKAN